MDSDVQHDSHNGGSGERPTPEPHYVAVGRVQRPHGIRGELRVKILSDFPDRLKRHAFFYLAHPDTPTITDRYKVARSRLHKKALLLKLDGCDDRNRAEELRNWWVLIPVEEAVPLNEGEYHHFQLLGMHVRTEEGLVLGEIEEIIDTGANDVYVVRGLRGETLLPAIEDVILEVDLEGNGMVVRLLPGMLGED